MELILGLPPMSQYDAAATPMYNAFTTTPNLTALHGEAGDHRHRRDEPRRRARRRGVSADELRRQEDMTPELELNEILWQSIHGAGALMPPPVHAGFVRTQAVIVGDDDDDAPVVKVKRAHR